MLHLGIADPAKDGKFQQIVQDPRSLRDADGSKTYVGKIFVQADIHLPMDLQKPDSYAIHFWCHCLPVTVPDARSRMVDEWLIARRFQFPQEHRPADDLGSSVIYDDPECFQGSR